MHSVEFRFPRHLPRLAGAFHTILLRRVPQRGNLRVAMNRGEERKRILAARAAPAGPLTGAARLIATRSTFRPVLRDYQPISRIRSRMTSV
jgi:hypothetical protein